jgi:hypothetical protein
MKAAMVTRIDAYYQSFSLAAIVFFYRFLSRTFLGFVGPLLTLGFALADFGGIYKKTKNKNKKKQSRN